MDDESSANSPKNICLYVYKQKHLSKMPDPNDFNFFTAYHKCETFLEVVNQCSSLVLVVGSYDV